MDVYHKLMKDRPKLLHKTPRAMRRWIGRVIQQYGTEAGNLRDLRAEHEALKKNLERERALSLNMEDIHETHLEKIKQLEETIEGLGRSRIDEIEERRRN